MAGKERGNRYFLLVARSQWLFPLSLVEERKEREKASSMREERGKRKGKEKKEKTNVGIRRF